MKNRYRDDALDLVADWIAENVDMKMNKLIDHMFMLCVVDSIGIYDDIETTIYVALSKDEGRRCLEEVKKKVYREEL